MRLLGTGEGFKVYDAGSGKCVVFVDDRKHITYRNLDAAKPEYAEYEEAVK